MPDKPVTVKCECLKCGNMMTSEEHCRDIKCSKCGGEMRRAERPGVGFDDKQFDVFTFQEIPKIADDDDSRTIDVQITPEGKWYHAEYGEVEFDDNKFDSALDYFKRSPAKEINGDYDHKSGPSSGKGKSLFRKIGQGLWSTVKFTKRAWESIKNGEYRHISPEISFNRIDKFTGKRIPMRVTGFAITNKPFFEGMQPLTAFSDENQTMTMCFSEDSVEDFQLAGTKPEGGNSKPEIKRKEISMDFKEMCEKHGLEFTEGMDAAKFSEAMEAKMNEVAEKHENEKKELEAKMEMKKTEADKFSERIENLEKDRFEKERDLMFKENLEAGRMLPAEQEKLTEVITKDNIKTFSEMLSTRPVLVEYNKTEGANGGNTATADEDKFMDSVSKFAEKNELKFNEALKQYSEEHPDEVPSIYKNSDEVPNLNS